MGRIISGRDAGPATPKASAGPVINRRANLIRSRALFALALLSFAALGSIGFRILWSYQNTPGVPILAPVEWDSQSRISRSASESTLLLFTHPDCTCTPATLRELERVLGSLQADGKPLPAIRVVMVGSRMTSGRIDGSPLIQAASALPGAAVIPDPDASEAKLFHARTSGQILLYTPSGRLIFSGGITAARGHEGPNRGEDRLLRSLSIPSTRARLTRFPVFGCSLLGDSQGTV